MMFDFLKKKGMPPDIKKKVSSPSNKLGLDYGRLDNIVYEYNLKARLRWKRPDLCPYCIGHGHTGMISHSMLEGTSYIRCYSCYGSGYVRDHLNYNSGHREL